MPKKVAPLNDLEVRKAKGHDSPCKLSDGGGLYVEVQPSGARYWRLKYRFVGQEKPVALGVYPDVSITRARAKRDEARVLLDKGIDPADAERENDRRKLIEAANTFETVAREWHQKMTPEWTTRHADYVLRRLESDVFPNIGRRAIATIEAPDVLDILRVIEKRVCEKHLQRYVTEFDFRWNTHAKLGFTDTDRAAVALKNIGGSRPAYRRAI